MQQLSFVLVYGLLHLVDANKKEFCIVGAGPASLQLGHYFHTAGYDFVTFEKGSSPGNFFRGFPLERRLNSMNAVSGSQKASQDVRLRHDWNSLLDNDKVKPMSERTSDLWPDAGVMADYLEDFAKEQMQHIQLNVKVTEVSKDAAGGFLVKTDTKGDWKCGKVIMASGLSSPVTASWPGADLVSNYEDIRSWNSGGTHWAEGLRLAVLGSGNAAFEVAKSVQDHSPETVIFTRTKPKQKKEPLRFAYRTHYPGDVRIKDSDIYERNFLDTPDRIVSHASGKYVVFKCHDTLCLVVSEPITDCAGRENAERVTFEIPKEGSLGAAMVKSKTKGGLPAFGAVEEGGLAEAIGIKEGDCIAKVNGKDILGLAPPQWGPKPWKAEALRTGDYWVPTSQSMDKETVDKHVARLKAVGVSDSEVRVQDVTLPTEKQNPHLPTSNKERKAELGVSEEFIGKYGENDKANSLHVKYSAIAKKQEVANTVADIRKDTGDDLTRLSFDKVIACFGWKLDRSIFAPDALPRMDSTGKRPAIDQTFQSVNVPGLYFVGASMHSVDFRKSSGGFINGFRYLARLMFRTFQKDKGVAFPHETLELSSSELSQGAPALKQKMLKRWQEASAPYHMHSYLGDGIVFRASGSKVSADYYEDVDIKSFRELHKDGKSLIWHFRYGDKSGHVAAVETPGPDTGYFGELSTLLHPVLEFQEPNPSNASSPHISRHFVREDVLQQYDSPDHKLFLSQFMGTILKNAATPGKQEL